jgi:hypothetical protein
VRGRDVELELGDEALQARDLALRYLHHEARQRRRVDDRMLERALQSAADEPRVERIVAVLHEHGALREAQERAPCVLEHRRADEHRAVDVVPLLRVRVDGRAAVDERVEERKRLLEREALGAELEDEERRVAGGLDVERDELSFVQRRLRSDLGRVDGDLLPRHRGRGATRLQEDRARAHRAIRSARRAQLISSRVTARSSRTAAP